MDRRKQAFNEITPSSKSIQNVSDTDPQRLQREPCGQIGSIRETQGTSQGSKPGGTITEGWDYWATEPNVGRVAHGVPNRVDRLKSLGNSIVPQIAYIIFEAIKEVNSN